MLPLNGSVHAYKGELNTRPTTGHPQHYVQTLSENIIKGGVPHLSLLYILFTSKGTFGLGRNMLDPKLPSYCAAPLG